MKLAFQCLARCIPMVVRRRHFPVISHRLQKRTFFLDTQHYSSESALENENENDPDFEGETDPFLRNEIKRFNVGKRWLARMMGEDPETFTQEKVNEAIQYLLPSHLWAKDARPMLRHPYELFPKTKDSEFDEYGRPISAAFYTGKPKYYDLTYEIWQLMEQLENDESELNFTKDEDSSVEVAEENGELKLTQWMKQFQLEQLLNEPMNEKLYDTIMFRLKRLSKHKRAYELRPFLARFQVPIYTPGKDDLKEVETYEGAARAMGYRKTAIAEVIVREGTGRITVNNRDFCDYFLLRNDREQIMYPLLLTNTMDKFDIETNVIGGGTSGKSGAIRLGISRAIASLCPEHFDVLNSNKLLIRDHRQKERKKPGRKRARRAFQWVRR